MESAMRATHMVSCMSVHYVLLLLSCCHAAREKDGVERGGRQGGRDGSREGVTERGVATSPGMGEKAAGVRARWCMLSLCMLCSLTVMAQGTRGSGTRVS